MMILSMVQLSVCVLVLFMLSQTQADLCQFPKVLTDPSMWQQKVSYAGRQVTTYIQFTGRTMEEVSYERQGTTEIVRECIQSYPNNKYMFKLTSTEDTVTYQCLQIIPRSLNALQIKSSSSGNSESISMCQETNLVLNPWLVINTNKLPNPEELNAVDDMCGITGGYDFSVYDYKKDTEHCNDLSLKPRMEVQCQKGDTLSIDFRHFLCSGSLDMQLMQTLTCLGNWEQEGYRFSLVTNAQDDDLWPKVWLFRFPLNPSDAEFEAILSSSIVTDTSAEYTAHTSTFHRLTMQQSDYPSVCEDEAQDCQTEQCQTGFEANYCKKTCGACTESQTDDCMFDDTERGEWRDISKSGTRLITIANSIIYADGLTPIQCISQVSNLEQSDKYGMVGLFKNGCKPRYTCVELVSQGDNVLQYHVSKMLKWPHKLNTTMNDICATEHFVPSEEDGSALYQSLHPRLLVRTLSQSRERESVECGIYGGFHFTERRPPNTEENMCSGMIKSCGDKDVFHVERSIECSAGPVFETFHCIASIEKGSSRIIVTEKESDPDDLNCWVVYQFNGETMPRLYKLHSGDCYSTLPNDIRYNNYTDYDAEYHVTGQESCRGIQSDPHTTGRSHSTPIGSSERPTTKHWYITQNIPPDQPSTEKPYILVEPRTAASSGTVKLCKSNVFVLLSAVVVASGYALLG